MKKLAYSLCLFPLLSFAGALQYASLNENEEYKITLDCIFPTTLVFPSKIQEITGGNVAMKENEKGDFFLDFSKGGNTVHLRALVEGARGGLNILCGSKLYALVLEEGRGFYRNIRFFEKQTFKKRQKNTKISPQRLMGLLERLKNAGILNSQPGNQMSLNSHAPSTLLTTFKSLDVRILEVMRFDREDTLGFKVLFKNKTLKPVYFEPQRIGVRVGVNIYYASLSDVSGKVPPLGENIGYFLITGRPNGGRANLSVNNKFFVVLHLVEDVEVRK